MENLNICSKYIGFCNSLFHIESKDIANFLGISTKRVNELKKRGLKGFSLNQIKKINEKFPSIFWESALDNFISLVKNIYKTIPYLPHSYIREYLGMSKATFYSRIKKESFSPYEVEQIIYALYQIGLCIRYSEKPINENDFKNNLKKLFSPLGFVPEDDYIFNLLQYENKDRLYLSFILHPLGKECSIQLSLENTNESKLFENMFRLISSEVKSLYY